MGAGSGLKARISWALYDWANSSFSAIISTFVFPAYFISEVVENETLGTTLWGNTVGTAGLIVAFSAPVLGAIADQGGRRKVWIAGFTLLCILATAALWGVQPGSEPIIAVMLLVGLGIVSAEFAAVFYNAILPSITSYDYLGRWSGWAWALGYVGGIGSLLLGLFAFVLDEAWFALPREEFAHVRATFVLVALWYALFSLPLFMFTPDEPGRPLKAGSAIRNGLGQLYSTIRQVRDYAHIVRFLVARMLFIDGLATLFTFGGVYAAGTFNMSAQQVLIFGIGLNVTAGIGAAAFAWVDDWLGSKRTILLSLIGLIVPGTVLLIVESVTWFWSLGMLLGIFVGPVQAASRSYMARTAPVHLRTQLFGLFAFSGKATAFIGPLLVGWVTGFFDSQRAGMSVIVILLLIGFFLMLSVPSAGKKTVST